MKIMCGHRETLSPTKGMYEELLKIDSCWGIQTHSLGMWPMLQWMSLINQ